MGGGTGTSKFSFLRCCRHKVGFPGLQVSLALWLFIPKYSKFLVVAAGSCHAEGLRVGGNRVQMKVQEMYSDRLVWSSAARGV